MPDPIAPVRDIGTVDDVHGYVIRIGVDHDAVTIGGAAYAMLGPEARDDFARLFMRADTEAKVYAEAHGTAAMYHPDPEINASVIADAIEAERADLAAGYPPSRWRCPCGTEHSRGHLGTIGVHRCLACGYTGTGGIMLDDGEG